VPPRRRQVAPDVSARIRSRMDRVGDVDLASQDVLVEIIQVLEMETPGSDHWV